MSTDTLKTSICDALAAFVRQRPGFDYSNYGDAASYRADSRRASLQKRDAETLLAAVRWRESISGADILEAARGGRLTITVHNVGDDCPRSCGRLGTDIRPGCSLCDRTGKVTSQTVRVDYCTGQYFPTEFRAGVCRVLSSALWNWQRENMPAPYAHRVEYPDGTKRVMQLHAAMDARSAGAIVTDLYHAPGGPLGSMSAGDWLRAKFRREFGSSLARRWFN